MFKDKWKKLHYYAVFKVQKYKNVWQDACWKTVTRVTHNSIDVQSTLCINIGLIICT